MKLPGGAPNQGHTVRSPDEKLRHMDCGHIYLSFSHCRFRCSNMESKVLGNSRSFSELREVLLARAWHRDLPPKRPRLAGRQASDTDRRNVAGPNLVRSTRTQGWRWSGGEKSGLKISTVLGTRYVA